MNIKKKYINYNWNIKKYIYVADPTAHKVQFLGPRVWGKKN